MSRPPKFSAQEVIDAIPGTGGIVSALASKLKCNWETANGYVEDGGRYSTARAAWLAESESVLDVAESVLVRNIQYAAKLQQDTRMPVDASDAKWLLTKRGKWRGYGDAVEVTGPDNGPVEIHVVYDAKVRSTSADTPSEAS
jgi:hypothetical protein